MSRLSSLLVARVTTIAAIEGWICNWNILGCLSADAVPADCPVSCVLWLLLSWWCVASGEGVAFRAISSLPECWVPPSLSCLNWVMNNGFITAVSSLGLINLKEIWEWTRLKKWFGGSWKGTILWYRSNNTRRVCGCALKQHVENNVWQGIGSIRPRSDIIIHESWHWRPRAPTPWIE